MDVLSTHELRTPEPVHLHADVIISIPPVEQGRCVATGSRAHEPSNSSLHPGRILALQSQAILWWCKMNPLRIFQSDEAKIKDGRFDRFILQKLEDYPEGYPRLAAFIDSDIDYTLVRRFGILHARILLYKQAEITELEVQLQKIDKEDEKTTDEWKLHSHVNLSRGDNKKRKELVDKIEVKLKEYDELLLRDQRLRNLRKPSQRLHKSVFNYIYNEHPVTKEDEQFIYHRDDFVCLSNRVEYNWLDDITHKFMDYDQSNLLRRICTTKEDLNRSTDPDVRYYSRSRLGVFISTFIAFISTMLLLVPVYLLITVPMDMRRMATVVMGFVFLFAAALSIFTDARRLDVFIATATYSAVLVVFLGNLQQSQGLKTN